MVDKRTVTIGVTINLGNYESLRVEISDTAGDECAVRGLIDFLGQTLDEFGVQDSVTRTAVERYKERVLDRDAPEDLESGYFPMEEVPLIHPVDEEEEEILLDVLEDTRIILHERSETDDKTEIATRNEETPQVHEGEFFCEKCGVPVSKVQRDVSNLFMGKTLCKKCMK